MKFCYSGSLSKKIHSIRIKLSHGGGALPYKLVGGGQQQKYQCLVAFHTMQQIIVLPISSCCLKMTDSESSVVFRVVWQGLSMNKIKG